MRPLNHHTSPADLTDPAAGTWVGAAHALSVLAQLIQWDELLTHEHADRNHGSPIAARGWLGTRWPLRIADVKYKLAGWMSHLRLMQEEAGNFNLLTADGRRGFASRMRSHQMAREKEEAEDLQEML